MARCKRPIQDGFPYGVWLVAAPSPSRPRYRSVSTPRRWSSMTRTPSRAMTVHLFDVELPAPTSATRSPPPLETSEERSCSIPIAGSASSSAMILRFPEFARPIQDSGLEVLAVPSAFTLAPARRTRRRWCVPVPSKMWPMSSPQPRRLSPERSRDPSPRRQLIVDPRRRPVPGAPRQRLHLLPRGSRLSGLRPAHASRVAASAFEDALISLVAMTRPSWTAHGQNNPPTVDSVVAVERVPMAAFRSADLSAMCPHPHHATTPPVRQHPHLGPCN